MSDLTSDESRNHPRKLVTGSGPNGYPTVQEFARAARKSKRTIRSYMARGIVSYTTVGRTPYPLPSALSDILDANERTRQRSARSGRKPERRSRSGDKTGELRF